MKMIRQKIKNKSLCMCGVDESGAAPHLIIASGLDGCDDMLHGGSSASRTLLVLDHAL